MTPDEMKIIEVKLDAIQNMLGAQHEQYNKDQAQRDKWHEQHFATADKVNVLDNEMSIVKKVSGWVLTPVIGAIVLAILGLVLKVGAK